MKKRVILISGMSGAGKTSATSVLASATTIPPLTNPINAIKKPMPAPMAYFKFLGIAFKTVCLKFVNEIIKNKTPLINTQTKA